MAISKCPKCGHHRFAMVGNQPKDSKHELMFIQCADCDTVVGVTESSDIGYLLKTLLNAMKIKF